MWGSEIQATCRSGGEAGHNILMEGNMEDTQRSQTISTKLHQIAVQDSKVMRQMRLRLFGFQGIGTEEPHEENLQVRVCWGSG